MSESRLDKRIASDALLAGVDTFWEDLHVSIAGTAEKVRGAFQRESTVTMNDHGTLITVECYEASPNQLTSTLTIRLDRGAKTVTVNIRRRRSQTAGGTQESPVVYRILADTDKGVLYFSNAESRLSAVDLAETLIVDRLMKIKL